MGKIVTQVVHDVWVGERYEMVNVQQITSDSPEDFPKLMSSQVAFWGKSIKDTGIQTQ